jgi:hypothetical protein
MEAVKDSKKGAAASQIARIFDDHFAALPKAERAKREKAFDKVIARIGFPSKSLELPKPRKTVAERRELGESCDEESDAFVSQAARRVLNAVNGNRRVGFVVRGHRRDPWAVSGFDASLRTFGRWFARAAASARLKGG